MLEINTSTLLFRGVINKKINKNPTRLDTSSALLMIDNKMPKLKITYKKFIPHLLSCLMGEELCTEEHILSQGARKSDQKLRSPSNFGGNETAGRMRRKSLFLAPEIAESPN